MKALYIAWQDPKTRSWHTVGRLSQEKDCYRFVYTAGALASPRFQYLGRMHKLDQNYWSQELFPLFSNRILAKSRPEYPDYVRWLALEPTKNADPVTLLARSGGQRVTDGLCVYPDPETDAEGNIEMFFLSHGLRYLEPAALESIDRLETGDRLRLRHENGNAHDHFALLLETEEPVTVGYCPRYLNRGLHRIMKETDVQLNVERVNKDAPVQFRLLCRAVFSPPLGVKLFADDEHTLLGKEDAAAA
ncbi:HIRAN domain-containing protein [Methylovulum psychrotolerans]|uniref:HIRAN domain-containing protein n=1 Tax=Methylovulum psychrotolerans TaxID=1704499 RepID=A0A2S5CQY6_9GAMM|nr:HIRAN domain-containing protein [Methylovulum psychrotolerans]POZ53186.1 hypothetical protein AADEFJLK_00202 [Methylovulum psychrotolerans]